LSEAGFSERQLVSDDAAAVAALISACDQTYLEDAPTGWAPPSQDSERERWKETLAEPGRWCHGVFDRSTTLVALVAIRQAIEADEMIAGRGHLSALFVHPDHWRKGIASRLLAAAETEMRQRGWQQAGLRTPEWAPARHFYEAQGWTPTGVREFHDNWDMWTIGYEKSLRPCVGLTP
jgi:GNAT superfamily N-acetyltransferase